MKPAMRQKATISRAVIGPDGKPKLDRFGKPIVEQVPTKARVRTITKLIRTAAGNEHDSFVEIDIPHTVAARAGDKVDYIKIDGTPGSGQIVEISESVNLTASRVWFRTLHTDGR